MSVRVIEGDARLRLAELPAESAHCCVTSPPYYGLRDYGTAGQIGMEPSPDEYVAELVSVFREVRRVLRKDGTLWLNLGDCYNAHPGQRKTTDKIGDKQETNAGSNTIGSRYVAECKPKDLLGIPWLVAFALRADGWYLRSDIIWAKPNPMPESVTDRPTKAHEYLFLLSRSERYFYDADAIKQPMKDVSLQRLSQPNVLEQPGGPKDPKTGNRSHKKAINNQAERLIKHEKWKTRFEGWDQYDKSLGRNARTVWEIATEPFPEAHFATFPPALIEPCILAGTSEKGVCGKCGAPWARDIDKPQPPPEIRNRGNGSKMDFHSRQTGSGQKLQDWYDAHPAVTLGWSASCQCDAPTVPAMVLDPFGGAGTTGLVADRLQRNAILIELNPTYAEMARKRIQGDAPLFASVA